jgi:hypothetical protein
MKKCGRCCRGKRCRSGFAGHGAGEEDFVRHYLVTALWSSNDNSDPETGGEPLDSNYDVNDIAPESRKKLEDMARKFYRANHELWEMDTSDDEDAGHNFWLTQNHHGAGFWDGDYPTNGKKLTELSHKYGEVDLYVGDDSRIYV